MALTIARGLGFGNVRWNDNRNDPTEWRDAAMAGFNTAWTNTYAGRSGRLGYYPLEHMSCATISPTSAGSFTSSHIGTVFNHIINANGTHPGKTSAYLSNKMPVLMLWNWKSFNASVGSGLFGDWGWSAHTVAVNTAGDRAIRFYQTSNTGAPGGSTYNVMGDHVEWFAQYCEANWAGLLQGVQFAESATELYTGTGDRAAYWGAIQDFIDLWIANAPSIPVGVGLNYAPGGFFGTYNRNNDQWSNSFYNPLFQWFVSRAPNFFVSFPDFVPLYYSGSCVPNQRQYIHWWCNNHPEMASIASNDENWNSTTNCSTIASRWQCGRSDPIAPDVADFHEGIYGNCAWVRPLSNIYYAHRYGFRGYNAHDNQQWRSDNIQGINATDINSWADNDIGTEPPPPSPQEVSVMAINCGSGTNYTGSAGVLHRADTNAFDAGAHGAAAPLAVTITNTDDPPLYQTGRSLFSSATAPLIFRPENLSLKFQAGTNWWLVIGKANTSNAPFNNRVSSASLYINGVEFVLYSEQNDLVREPETFKAFDQTYGPFTLGPTTGVRVEFRKGTIPPAEGTVNPSIKRLMFFRSDEPPNPPDNPSQGEPGAPTDLEIEVLTADGFTISWTPPTVTVT